MSAVRALPLAALLILAITGCAAEPAPTPTATLPTGIDHDAVIAELGYYPADTPWAQGEREQALADAADTWWAFVTTQFPDAQRPAASTVEEVEFGDLGASLGAALDTCLDAAGVSRGGVSSLEWVPTTLVDTLAWYTCKVEYPVIPEPPVNDAQLGYLYDLLTGFVVPCYESRGSAIEQPPTRDDFIAEWPNQNWFPSSSADPGSEQNESDIAACASNVEQYAAD